MADIQQTVLVTGGHGFIGSHVAQRLHRLGYKVRIADIAPTSYLAPPEGTEVMVGNLCDPSFCARAVRRVDIVLHFAATMGGMGTIHEVNDFVIYHENHTMTLNLVAASVKHGVKRFLYASSACVYPQSLQDVDDRDVSLKETDVWVDPPPQPQGLYGLEKLHSEGILLQYSSRMLIHVARFHNIYGSPGCWQGGREKAPAAFLRKAIAAKWRAPDAPTMEVWGNGTQRRSFCHVKDAVEAIILLMRSECHIPVNIGSTEAVTMNELADIAARSIGLDLTRDAYHYVENRPAGVGSRNSNNDLVFKELGWKPTVSLAHGMQETGRWIESEIERMEHGMEECSRSNFLRSLLQSKLVDLQRETVTYAILLPITSRGSKSLEDYDCLSSLSKFAKSLALTTRDDSQRLGQRFRFHIYLAIDHDDDRLWQPIHQGNLRQNRAEELLRGEGIDDVTSIECSFPKGHVCSLWRSTAKQAWEDGCDYFVLMGDDVLLQDVNWMSNIHAAFASLAETKGVPHGFGCVALTDTSFPGMPTFPVVHRIHMDLFNGQVVPRTFVNQDGDPFLYQLYRRWDCSRMVLSRIHNTCGGSDTARYKKQPAKNWTFDTLDHAVALVECWLEGRFPHVQRKLTLDVVIPCYRVDVTYLDRFLKLEASDSCNVMFIIIIDDPQSPNIAELLRKHEHRPDVRIRVNKRNLGASGSRNRGMRESAAEWIHFLDDDVIPDPSLLFGLEECIRTRPNAAGFVGTTLFPLADTIFKTAVHLAYVTFFWDIAKKIETDIPWGVTANLTTRHVQDGIQFDLAFPNSGGGEDIDFCRKRRQYSLRHGGEGFRAAPKAIATHPWWNNGKRSYWRFYMWSKGDGRLIKMYPDLVYRDVCPNSAELMLLSAATAVILGVFSLCIDIAIPSFLVCLGLSMAPAVIAANLIHDLYRHLWRDTARTRAIHSDVEGFRWILSVLESSLIRMFSETGRMVGLLERREYKLLGKRFDWFAGRWGSGPIAEESKNALQRASIWALIISVTAACAF